VSLDNRADRDCKPARSACAVAARDRDTIGDDDQPSHCYPPAAANDGPSAILLAGTARESE
jgi:hypothetical protein